MFLTASCIIKKENQQQETIDTFLDKVTIKMYFYCFNIKSAFMIAVKNWVNS